MPERYIRPQAINTGISEIRAEKLAQYLLHGAVYRTFVGLHHLRSPWGCLCVLSVAALSNVGLLYML